MLICFCLLISVSFSGNAVAKKNKGSEVLRNDKQDAEVMVEEEGIQYIASMDKSSGEIKMRLLNGDQEEKEYVVLLDGFEEDENGVASIYGRYIDQETGEVEKFGGTLKKSIALLSSGAIPLDLQLKLALEALLLATAYIVVNGLDYVLTDALEDHIEKNKSKY
ncbi:hypothetical protein [Brevibacillus centrosporus]|uniref:hypothetical protein n=1 Tax=Brevibacillus centrosporus TaxID=54910 RepID=UPI00380AAACB